MPAPDYASLQSGQVWSACGCRAGWSPCFSLDFPVDFADNHVRRWSLSNPPSPHTYVLRGFIKQRAEGRFVAVCLRPGLVVEGPSKRETLSKLEDLIEAYVLEAYADGQATELMARRAPLAFYCEYLCGRAMQLFHFFDGPFQTFTETRPVPTHA